MPRKIVQIAVSSEGTSMYSNLYALCDDGTVWIRAETPLDQGVWRVMPPIPQPEGTPDAA